MRVGDWWPLTDEERLLRDTARSFAERDVAMRVGIARDAKRAPIYEGTNQIDRLIVAEELFKGV